MNKRAESLTETNKESESQIHEHKIATKRSVIIYIATLFLVVIFFIVLSYLINNRNNSQIHTLHEKNITAQQSIEDLQNENLELKSEKSLNEEKIEELEQKVSELESDLRETRVNWRNDVQEVLDNSQEQYNELMEQYNALLENNDIKVDSND